MTVVLKHKTLAPYKHPTLRTWVPGALALLLSLGSAGISAAPNANFAVTVNTGPIAPNADTV
jgi:hypothetical protein